MQIRAKLIQHRHDKNAHDWNLTIELSIRKLLAFNNRDNPHIMLCSHIECTATIEETILHDNNNKDYLKIVADNLGTSKQNWKIDEEGTMRKSNTFTKYMQMEIYREKDIHTQKTSTYPNQQLKKAYENDTIESLERWGWKRKPRH